MKKSHRLELKIGIKDPTYCVTSEPTEQYNCIAWAAGQTDRPWWPIPYQAPYYWPEEAEEEDLETFIKGFGCLGYVVCQSRELEVGFEKVALYVDENGDPCHMARQLSCGKWTSKCGGLEDITHTLEGLEGPFPLYGKVACIMKRPFPVLVDSVE